MVFYLGEDGGAASSEDEDLFDSRAYTRDELAARTKKWDAILAFEKSLLVVVERAPSHRAICRSVRPAQGADVVLSTTAADGTRREREVVKLGDDFPLAAHVATMRRGEVRRVGGAVVELHCVREDTCVAPTTKQWTDVQGCAWKKRLSLRGDRGAEDRVAKRPKWGDAVEVRVATTEAGLDAADAALRTFVLGEDEAVEEGLEACLLAMKPGERCHCRATGDFARSADGANDAQPSSFEAFVSLDAVHRRGPDPKRAAALKARGAAAWGRGQWRRAEALFSRALAQLIANEEDGSDDTTALVFALLLNVAMAARKRGALKDEAATLTRALALKVAYAEPLRLKALVRRAANAIDRELWAAAADDLRAALQGLLKDPTQHAALLSDARRQQRRLKEAKAGARAREKSGTYRGIAREEHDFTEKPILYGAEIDAVLKKQKPWLHDPDYATKLGRAPRPGPEPTATVLREDDLSEEFSKLDAADEEQSRINAIVARNLQMRQMYDTNGTGRRGVQPRPGHLQEQMGSHFM